MFIFQYVVNGKKKLSYLLGLDQGIDLCHHAIGLVVDLRLPEVDISKTLSQPLAHITLGAACAVVDLTHQTGSIQTHPLSSAAYPIGAQVVGRVGGHPVVGGVAGVEGIASSSEHRGHLDAVQLGQLVASRAGTGHAHGDWDAGLNPSGGVVGAGSPGKSGKTAAEWCGCRVGVVRLVGRLHGGDGGQEGGRTRSSYLGAGHVGGRLGMTEVLHLLILWLDPR